MRLTKLHLYIAGALAILLGWPMTKDALASDTGDIVGAGLDLGVSIAKACGGS